MITLVLQIDETSNDLIATKETIAMALEPFGNIRVISISKDGREPT